MSSLVVWWVSEFAGGLVGERVGRYAGVRKEA